MNMDNYRDNIDIIMTALTEIRHHVDDKHYSEIKSKIAVAAYSLGQLTATCYDLEKTANKPVQVNSELQASNNKQKAHIGYTERQIIRLQERNNQWEAYCAQQDTKIKNLETAREQLNSSVQHGRKIMKAIGKHK